MNKSKDPEIFGEQWLGLMNEGHIEVVWRNFAELAKARLPLEMWKQAVKSTRLPFGAVSERRLHNRMDAKSLPGLPDNEYVVLQFVSKAKTCEIIETVTVGGEDESLRVFGYFVKRLDNIIPEDNCTSSSSKQ